MMDTADFDAMLLAMRTITDQLAEAPNSKITLKEAAYVAGVTEAQMRKRCEDNRYAVDPGGYGYKKVGRWEVVIAPFVKSLPVSALARFRDVKAWMIA
jgi:hypothetical protein